MLDLLAQIVQRGESFNLTYTRSDDDRVRVIVQPRLDHDATHITDTAALAARAALQCPLVLEGAHADVAAKLAAHIATTRDDRETLKDAYDTLRGATHDAAKVAAEAAKNKQSAAVTTKGAASADTTAKAPSAPASAATGSTADDAAAKPAADGAQPSSLFS